MSPSTVIEASFTRLPSIFVRLWGRNGVVREYRALVDAGSEYCIIPKVDAFMLGYPEAANDDPIVRAENTLTFAAHGGWAQAALVRIVRVDVGQLSFNDVDFLAFDLSQATGFDVALGSSLLKSLNLTIDYPSGRVVIERGS